MVKCHYSQWQFTFCPLVFGHFNVSTSTMFVYGFCHGNCWQNWNAILNWILSNWSNMKKQIIVENSIYHSVWMCVLVPLFLSFSHILSFIHWHLIHVMRFHCIQTSHENDLIKIEYPSLGSAKKKYKLISWIHIQILHLPFEKVKVK